jgi:hypothetical protein
MRCMMNIMESMHSQVMDVTDIVDGLDAEEQQWGGPCQCRGRWNVRWDVQSAAETAENDRNTSSLELF